MLELALCNNTDVVDKLIRSSIEDVSKEFGKDELAFLALTTKIELPLRDRWAYVLYKELIKKNLIVSREWGRVDLAVLKDKTPVALIELKAIYTFDAVNENGFYKKTIENLRKDERKARKLAEKNTNVYTVLLATHPLSEVPSNLEGVIKYHPGINNSLKKFGGEKAVASIARSRIEKEFGSQKIVSSGVLHGGFAFGIDTNIMYWIIRT